MVKVIVAFLFVLAAAVFAGVWADSRIVRDREPKVDRAKIEARLEMFRNLDYPPFDLGKIVDKGLIYDRIPQKK